MTCTKLSPAECDVCPGKPAVWVCIAVFNRISYTLKCLDQLRNQTYPNVRPVVVDDGSTDGTPAMIRTVHPEVQLLQGGSLYWTAAMHMGLDKIVACAGASDYVLLLNDDLVFGSEFVEELVKRSTLHPGALIQAVESCVEDDLVWQGGVRINWWTAKHHRVNYRRRLSEFPAGHFESSDYLTGRGVLVPIEVLKKVGNYDLSHTQYGDTEFSRRAAKNGHNLIVCYDVPVWSYEKAKHFNEAEVYSPRDLRRYYCGILSSTRLSLRWKQASAMTNSKLQALVFFGFDVTRITGHFVRRLRISL